MYIYYIPAGEEHSSTETANTEQKGPFLAQNISRRLLSSALHRHFLAKRSLQNPRTNCFYRQNPISKTERANNIEQTQEQRNPSSTPEFSNKNQSRQRELFWSEI